LEPTPLGLVRLVRQVRISAWQHRNIYRLDKLLAARREEVGKSKFFPPPRTFTTGGR